MKTLITTLLITLSVSAQAGMFSWTLVDTISVGIGEFVCVYESTGYEKVRITTRHKGGFGCPYSPD